MGGKKFYSLILVIMLSGLLFSVCTVWSAGDTPTWKRDTSPVTFDWYVNYSWFGAKWGVDSTSQYITEKTGVSLNLIAPAGNENEKLNTMIAANTLPDFITLGWWEDPLRKMVEGDLVYSLNKLADKYDPYFFKVAVPARLNWYRQKDGNVYCYPNASYSPSDIKKYKVKSNQTFEVRKDIYEAIGKPDMRTPEGFLKALKMAKEKFPAVNGQPLIPIGFHEFTDVGCTSLEGYLQNFLAIPPEINGKFQDPALGLNHPEYLRWLKTLCKANQMGLLSKDIFIDKRSQMDEKIAQGRYFALLYQRTDLDTQNASLYLKNPNGYYMAIDGPSNSKLSPPTLQDPGVAGWTVTLISKNCKNPKRAVQFLSYCLSEEGQHDFYFGKKGVCYEDMDGKSQFLPDVLKLRDTNRASFDTRYGGSKKYWMLMDGPLLDQWEPEEPMPTKQLADWTVGKLVSKSAYFNTIPPSDSEEGIVQKKISNLWGITLPKLLLAKSDGEFEKTWNDFQAKKMKLGYAKVQKWQQAKVNENKRKLGIK